MSSWSGQWGNEFLPSSPVLVHPQQPIAQPTEDRPFGSGANAVERAHQYTCSSSGSSTNGEEDDLPPPPPPPPRRFRTAFTAKQLYELERNFHIQPYLGTLERKELAASLNLTQNQVRVWFQNRRMKHKQELQNYRRRSLQYLPAFLQHVQQLPPALLPASSMYPHVIYQEVPVIPFYLQPRSSLNLYPDLQHPSYLPVTPYCCLPQH